MQQVHLKKGEKLLRSIKQLCEMNLDKIRRQRVSSCPIGRHLTGLSLINSNPENNEEEEES